MDQIEMKEVKKEEGDTKDESKAGEAKGTEESKEKEKEEREHISRRETLRKWFEHVKQRRMHARKGASVVVETR